jgi:uncharacterized membrane protein
MDFQTLQTLFYVLGIITMIVGLIILIAIGILIFYIRRRINEIHNTIEDKVNLITNRSAEFAVDTGAALAEAAVKKMKKIITKE